jgi:hypothetical protein
MNIITIGDDKHSNQYTYNNIDKYIIIKTTQIFSDATNNNMFEFINCSKNIHIETNIHSTIKNIYIGNCECLILPNFNINIKNLIINKLKYLQFINKDSSKKFDLYFLDFLNNITIENIKFPCGFILNNKEYSNFKKFFEEMSINGYIDTTIIIQLYKMQKNLIIIFENKYNDKIKYLEEKIKYLENKW